MSTVNAIELSCPACGKLLKIKPEMAGQRLACPKQGCGAAIVVPGIAAKGPTGFRAKLMTAVGLTFAVIALGLTIQQLELHPGWFISVALIALVVVAQSLTDVAKTGFLALFTLVGLSTPALFFLFEQHQDRREAVFYVGAALFFVGSCYLIFRMYAVWSQFEWGNTAKRAINRDSILVWFALIASSIAFSWVTYYRFLTPLGETEFVARRLVFTLFFVVVGVLCSVVGRNSRLPFLGALGLTYMAVGVIKALAYDLHHLDGGLRIGVFAGCGVVLLLGAFLMKKSPLPIPVTANASAFIED